MRFLTLLMNLLLARRGLTAGGGLSNTLLQGLLTRLMSRTPMGFIATLLLQKALQGNGRVFGMNLAARRQTRMAWLTGLLRR